MTRGPIFIAGLERSGTTLLYALLASHPNIAMTRRTHFWQYFFNRFGDLSCSQNLERCIGAMMRYERIAILEPDWQGLRDEFRRGEATYARLLALLEEQYARRLGKQRWGDKSLDTERYTGTVFRCYPDAKIVHILRDPRDRYVSARKSDRVGRGGIASGTAAWLWSAGLAKRNLRRYPQRYKVIRFESLVFNTENALKDLCSFLGEDYAPEMLAMEGASGYRDKGGNSSFDHHRPGSISTAPVGRFRKLLSERELAFMQGFAASRMAEFDYTPEPVHLTGAERLKHYLFDWPRNLACIACWHALNAWKNGTGRSPSARRLLHQPMQPGQAQPWAS